MVCSSHHPLNTTANESYSIPITSHRYNLEKYLDTFHVSCAPITIILNTVVIYIAATKVDLSVRLSQHYVLSMSIAELTFGCIYLATKMMVNCFPRWFCQLYYLLTWASQLLSVSSLLLLNLDKFISLQFPLRYQQIVTRKRVLFFTLTAWTIDIVYPLVVFISPVTTIQSVYLERSGIIVATVTECYVKIQPVYYMSMLVGFYVLPTLISLLLSIYIFWIAQALSKSYLSSLGGGPAIKKRAQRKMIKRILFVFSSTTWTAFTYLPYRIVYCYSVFCSFSCSENDMDCYKRCGSPRLIKLGYLLWFLLPLGCICNPIITIITQQIYRNEVKRMLQYIFIHKCHFSEKLCICLATKGRLLRRSATYSMRETEPGVTLKLRPSQRRSSFALTDKDAALRSA